MDNNEKVVPSTLSELVQEIEETQKNIQESYQSKQEEENGESPEAPVEDDIGKILSDAITSSTVEILSDPAILNQFNIMKAALDENNHAGAITALTSIIAISASHAAYQAIIFHDSLLKQELTKQFENIANYINNHRTNLGLQEVKIQVLEKKINDLITNQAIDKLSKEIN